MAADNLFSVSIGSVVWSFKNYLILMNGGQDAGALDKNRFVRIRDKGRTVFPIN